MGLVPAGILSVFLHGCASMPEKADLTVVHMTDLHLDSNGKVSETAWTHKIEVGGYKLHKPCTAKSFELLEKSVAYINSKVKPDVVVITGDLINRRDDLEAMKKGRDILSRLNCPFIVARGDHEFPRKPGEEALFGSVFGELDGIQNIKGFDFVYLSYEDDKKNLEKLEKFTEKTGSPISFLCLHRMLFTSWCMDGLGKIYCRTLTAPDSEEILEMLERSPCAWVVLCGHSHTNYESSEGKVMEFCTSSLAEYPHEIRVIKVRDGELFTDVIEIEEE